MRQPIQHRMVLLQVQREPNPRFVDGFHRRPNSVGRRLEALASTARTRPGGSKRSKRQNRDRCQNELLHLDKSSLVWKNGTLSVLFIIGKNCPTGHQRDDLQVEQFDACER
jgi:hypothetical protein